MDAYRFSLIVGWASMLAGAISGAWIGMSFDDDQWLDGYGSFRRRLLRLGHIASFGLGFLNVLFASTISALLLPLVWVNTASVAFAAAAVTMPACCYLTAWRRPWRRLFPVPVVSAVVGLACVIAGLLR